MKGFRGDTGFYWGHNASEIALLLYDVEVALNISYPYLNLIC